LTTSVNNKDTEIRPDSHLFKISPDPSFSKRGNDSRLENSPFDKGGLRGISS
jgi:hypothetical protein